MTLLLVAAGMVFAQGGYQVKGVVVDAQGPVIGATVLQQGTMNGTTTGLDGDYVLRVPDGDALVEIIRVHRPGGQQGLLPRHHQQPDDDAHR